MFEWLVILYILFIFISAILDATKKAKDQKEIIIKKIERTKEKTTPQELPKEMVIPQKTIEQKNKIEEFKKEEKIKETHEETYIEKSIKNNLPEIIALIEIIGPPKAYQNWTAPYKKKN